MIKEIKKRHYGHGKYCVCECDYCGKRCEVNYYKATHQKHQFCCKECSYRWKSKNIKGEKHHLKGVKRDPKLVKKLAEFLKGKKRSIKISEAQRKRMAHKGINHPAWKGGKFKNSTKYTEIYAPEHPNCTKQGYMLEHRLLMEKHLNRYLTKEEIVHHINEDRSDNRIENLQLCANHSEHMKLHNNLSNIYWRQNEDKRSK